MHSMYFHMAALWLKFLPHAHWIEFHILHLLKHEMLSVLFIFPLCSLNPKLAGHICNSLQKTRFWLFYAYFSHLEFDPFVHFLSFKIPSIFLIHMLSRSRQNPVMNPSHEYVLILWDFHVTVVQAYHFAMSREPIPTKGKDKKKMNYQYD